MKVPTGQELHPVQVVWFWENVYDWAAQLTHVRSLDEVPSRLRKVPAKQLWKPVQALRFCDRVYDSAGQVAQLRAVLLVLCMYAYVPTLHVTSAVHTLVVMFR